MDTIIQEESNEIDESSLSESEEDENSHEILPPKELPQRVTRGTRMSKVTQEQANADEEFWGQDAWNVDDIDDDYSTEEEEEDEIESDFDEEEIPDDEVHDEEVDKKRKLPKKRKQAAYKDPHQTQIKKKPQVSEKIKSSASPIISFFPTQRELRHSTTNKTINSAEFRLNYGNESKQEGIKRKTVEKKRFTQKELLAEAVITEIENTRSLKYLQQLEDEKKNDTVSKNLPKGNFTRYHSKIGQPKTITFMMEELPSIFNQKKPKRRHHHKEPSNKKLIY